MDTFIKGGIKVKKIIVNKHLQNSLSIIHYLGLWPEKTKHKYLYTLYIICSMVFLSGIILISEVIYVITNWGNLKVMMAGAALLMTNSTYFAKVIYVIYRRKHITDLIDITSSEIFNKDNDKYERTITHYTWQATLHHIIYQSFGSITIITWGCIPILNTFTGTSKELPMLGWYPYNITSTPAFEITWLHQFLVVLISCINNVAIDTIITGLVNTACCQLKILNYNIASLHYMTDEIRLSNNVNFGKPTLKANNESYTNLKLCIEHSEMIFLFTKKIQNLFGTLIFFQLLVNCIIVCLIAFNISQMKSYNPLDLFGMLMYMCCMSYQIFIFCWHGNELYLHSVNICSSAYVNDWWNNTRYFKQTLLIMMTRTQLPLILCVGNIMELSLQNFIAILRMSYSIFTVLKTTAS